MTDLHGDEAPLSQPFWIFQDVAESRVVGAILERRFPGAYAVLSDSLERADPLDIVYPGNPGEYSDVVFEIIVLLAPVGGDIKKLSGDDVEQLLREGLARRFGELPDESRVHEAVRMILES
ncbi:hypothetical protein [Actinoplanes sp. NPDC026670]|uniref:hypothetical protein n=1 Tax=Actinoplanes sp. NPDC026670 TaxID=3154700 RepID=UPI0033CB2812